MTWLDAFLARDLAPEGIPVTGMPWDRTLEALCLAHPEDAPYLRAERAAVLTLDAGWPDDQAERLAGLRQPHGHILPTPPRGSLEGAAERVLREPAPIN